MKMSASTEIMGDLPVHSLFEEFSLAANDFAAMQQEHQAALLAGNCTDFSVWQQSREQAFRNLARVLEKIVAYGRENTGCVARAQEIMGKLLAEEDALHAFIMARQLKVQEQLLAMRKGKEALQGYNMNKGLIPRPRYFSNRM